MAKKVFQVEVKGQKEKYTFDTAAQAGDYAFIVATFGGKQYKITTIFINEEVAK